MARQPARKKLTIPGVKKRDNWKHQRPLFLHRYRKVKPMAKINRYYCGKCGTSFITREKDLPETFTAPFLIECLTVLAGGKRCEGHAQSAMYKDIPADAVVTHEWRKIKGPQELQNLGPNKRAFLAQGGISLFPVAAAVPVVAATET